MSSDRLQPASLATISSTQRGRTSWNLSSLLPVFERLNVLKWQLPEKSALDIFTGGGFHGSVVTEDFDANVFAVRVRAGSSSVC